MKQIIFSILVIACVARLQAQDIYIQYDKQWMDKLQYKYVEPNPTTQAIYSSYRLTNEPSVYTFLQAGVENVKLVDNVDIYPVDVHTVRFDVNTIEQINAGNRQLFLCRKFNDEWALLHIGSVERFDATQNNIFAYGPDFDFNLNPSSQFVGDNLSTRYENVENIKASVFFLGQTQACNTTAYHLKKSPSQTCLTEQELLILPNLGVIRNQTPDGKTFELTDINGTDVCSYLSANKQTEPNAINFGGNNNIPSDYSAVVVRSKTGDDLPVVQDNNASSSEYYNTLTNSKLNFSPNTSTENSSENNMVQDDEHLIQKGESLLSIARQHGVTLAELRQWNNLNTDVIYPGTILKIAAQENDIAAADNVQDASTTPEDYSIKVTRRTAVEQPSVSENTSASDQNTAPVDETITPQCSNIAGDNEHVVQKGESLFGIARQYGLSDKQLLVWNKLTSSKIYPCSVLKIAAPASSRAVPMSYNTKVVVKSLAPNIKSGNKSKKNIPQYAGKSVKVRDGVVVNSKSVGVKKNSGLHVVQKNETVSSLAKRFELTDANFRDLNVLSKNEGLEVGQVVRTQKNCACEVADVPTIAPKTVVPISYATVSVRSKSVSPENHNLASDNTETVSNNSNERKYHIVSENETLYSISKKYGVSVERLMALNRLEPNEVIIPNQKLALE